MFRTPVFTAVDVVMREQDALAGCPHVAEMMSEYLDASPKWTIERAACAGYMTLLDRLGKRELPISPRELDWALRTAADRANRSEGFTTVASNFALLNGHIEILRWLNEQRAKQLGEEQADEYAGAVKSSTRWIRRERRLSATVLEAPQRRPRRMSMNVLGRNRE
ncbi:hypothetical protein PHYBOEH_005298 [Phytophthora boehmeriae]|uniref:Uncharacterized protein n=1 Tax=Phytophthora boehmeriae TaxID=109152 RepID=A0A8T1WRI3_9STRA|nr:hypothetical protein PHYBOEH_005298 [Phytophthora boehmeriae]